MGLETHGADGSPRTFPNKFVANLPYAVAATLVLDFFQKFSQLESATVMVQKEVADRMCAEPGSKNYGAYTVKLRLYAEPAGRFLVSPNNFFPPPHVDSSVLRLNRRPVFDADGEPQGDVRYGRRRFRESPQDHFQFVQDVFCEQGKCRQGFHRVHPRLAR